MRIAYLTQPYPPMVSGASIVAEQLANAMADRGHQVLVIAASDSGYQYVEQKKNLTVLRLKSIHNPMRVGQRIMFLQRNSVLRALHEFRPDVIHVHEPVQMGLVGLKYVKRIRIPITMTTHQLPWFVTSYIPNIPALRAWTEKIVWKYAHWLIGKYTLVVSPTKTIANVIKTKIGIQPQTVNYGICLQTFHPHTGEEDKRVIRAQFNIPAGAPIILHVGRLDIDKRVDQVIRAAANVIKNSDAHLFIVGDGCQKSALVLLCTELGIEACVHFLGFVLQKDELAKIYRASNVFAISSEIETQGIVILEAAACGLPIVAVNATCIPEVVHQGRNGYLTQPGDIDSMSRSIEVILNNMTVANSMSRESRLIAEKYSAEVTFDEHERLYYQMLKKINEQPSTTKNWQFRKWRKQARKSI